MGQEKITLTKAELKKVMVIEKLVAHQVKVVEAAELLGLSPRQVLRLEKSISQKELRESPTKIEVANLHTPFLRRSEST